jgi:hypothetical protein
MCTQFHSENEKGRDHSETYTWMEYNIKMDLKWGMDWIHLFQDRALVNTVMNLRVSEKSGKSFTS